MQNVRWIAVGRGDTRAELERIVVRLRKSWKERYEYRIKPQANKALAGSYELQVRHV